MPKVFGHLAVIPICGVSPNCWHKFGSTQLSRMDLYAVALRFAFTGTKSVNLFQHDNAPLHKEHDSPEMIWKNSGGLSPDLNPTK